MGRMERVKHVLLGNGWTALMSLKAVWTPAVLAHPVDLQRVSAPFSVQTYNGLLSGVAGDYLLRDPVTGFVTLLPEALVMSLFVNEGMDVTVAATPVVAKESLNVETGS